MKRKKDLYKEIYRIENIMTVFNEICRNTRNKKKVARYKENKCANIFKIYTILTNKTYVPGDPFVFTVYEPKKRIIESQSMDDKLVNHLVSRYILYPAILPCLIETNVASRKYKGTQAGLRYFNKYSRKCKIKYGTYYLLKCDIKKYFHSIDKQILKEKLAKKIKDKDALNIVNTIIDHERKGMGIGKMTSQVFALFYLNDLDHYIKEVLKIKYYIRYQDDLVLLYYDKDYLKYCLSEINNFLKKEKLELNSKTRIYKNTNNIVFLGRNRYNNSVKYRDKKRKLKKKKYLYDSNKINLNSYISSYVNYKNNR